VRIRYRSGDRHYEVEVTPRGDGQFHVSVDGVTLDVRAELRGGALELTSSAGAARAWVSRVGDRRFVSAPAIGEAILEVEVGRRRTSGEETGSLSSPMPGKVVKVLVAVGDEVEKGQPLLIVEAMKTELQIAAPRAGKVTSIALDEGELCDAGQALAQIEE